VASGARPDNIYMIGQWLLFLGMMALVGTWLSAMRNRERALSAARRVCSAQSIQLLDETVGLSGLRMRRQDGLLRLMLRYGFEVSSNGQDRIPGHLWMADGRITSISTFTIPTEVLSDQETSQKVVDLMQRLRKKD
jgi:hypothetical protein